MVTVKTINLTKGKSCIIDDEDYELVSSMKWYAKFNGRFYAVNESKNSRVFMHRLIAGVKHAELDVDHINRNTLDNRRANLRIVTRQQNLFNVPKRKNCVSVYKGVCRDKSGKRWRARISVSGETYHLGVFELETDAARAYNRAAVKHFGEFAFLNEIKDA